jgi:TolA-binding protein
MESILKSGFCYYELGNFEKSLTIFKQIITDYPNSSVSRLAAEKLNSIR